MFILNICQWWQLPPSNSLKEGPHEQVRLCVDQHSQADWSSAPQFVWCMSEHHCCLFVPQPKKRPDYLSSLLSVRKNSKSDRSNNYVKDYCLTSGSSYYLQVSFRPGVYSRCFSVYYITLAGSHKGLPEMSASWSCCAPFSHLYVRVTEVAVFHCFLALFCLFRLSQQHVVWIM